MGESFIKVLKSIGLMLPVVLMALIGYWVSGKIWGFEESKYMYHIGGIMLFAGGTWYFWIVKQSMK